MEYGGMGGMDGDGGGSRNNPEYPGMSRMVPGRGRGGVNPSPEDLGEGGSWNYQPLNASAQKDLGWRI